MTDSVYFRYRAQQEREAAMKAPHPMARQAHIDMALAHETRARGLMAEERTSSLRVLNGR